MILLDYNQVAIANIMVQMAHNRNRVELGLVRHMILKSIRSYRNKFRGEFGDLIICCDDRNYWRKDSFPYYKGNRKADRENSKIDWNQLFGCLNTVRDELIEFFPYKVLRVDRAEADDIIGRVCNRFGMDTAMYYGVDEKILILSGDKDFGQLQKYSNVWQYSPATKKWIEVDDPKAFLQEHIIKGDSSDGIPNIASSDACVVEKIRQTPIRKRKIESWKHLDPKDYCGENMLRNWHRNNTMVNLDMIPEDIITEIDRAFDTHKVPPRGGLFNYFIEKGLKELTQHIGDF